MDAASRGYARFAEEFEPQTFVFENDPRLLSLEGGRVFRVVTKESVRRGYHVIEKMLGAPPIAEHPRNGAACS